jgi:hypothetical protein
MWANTLEKETNNHENRNSKKKKKKKEILDEKSLFCCEYSVHVTNLN